MTTTTKTTTTTILMIMMIILTMTTIGLDIAATENRIGNHPTKHFSGAEFVNQVGKIVKTGFACFFLCVGN